MDSKPAKELVLELAAQLRRRREALGMGISEVAEKAGLHRNTVGFLENGHVANVTLETLCVITGVLGLEVRVTFSELGWPGEEPS